MNIVDIIIPVWNEENYIKDCLNSVISFELPKEIEVNIYLVDGGSTDNTLNMIQSFLDRHSNIFLIHNKKRIQSCALNLALKEGKGDYVMRLDAHTVYPNDYLKNLYETSTRVGAENVGGTLETLPGSNSYGAALVQAISTSVFGVGNSGFRVGSMERSVDTVPFGFFRKSIFNQIGQFNESLVRAQDYEFNQRIIKSGGTIWINPKITATYYNQPSLIAFLKKIFFKEAPYNSYMWYVAPYSFSLRHSITLFFVLGLFCGLFLSKLSNFIFFPFITVMISYFSLALFFSFQQAKRYKYIGHIFILPFLFFIFHLLHGMGVLIGLSLILIRLIANKPPLPQS